MKLSLMKVFGGSVLLIIAAMLFSGCLKSEDPITPEEALDQALAGVNQTQLATDLDIIDDSLARWNLTSSALQEPKGVRYTIQTLGTGPKPTLGSIITVKYKAILLKNGRAGAAFDESDNLQFNLYGLIVGFQTTLPLLPKGTVATLYVPSGYAYGPVDLKNNAGTIIVPKNSNLIFEIELLDVQ